MKEVYSLKWMAESGYVMGLSTIGEVASHMESHYDAYWLISDVANHTGPYADWCDAVASHLDSSIDLWLTDDDKRRIDEEMETAMAEGPSEGGQRDDELREATPDEKDEEEGEQENKHF
jgi:hypothetical protein